MPQARFDNLQCIVDEIATRIKAEIERGKVAGYIPELERVDPNQFGLAVIDAQGNLYAGGDADTPFSIQSISKVFALTLALAKIGNNLWRSVGREPSGTAFNSIVQLEHDRGRPRNPFVNAGAIVTTDQLLTNFPGNWAINEFMRFVRFAAGDDAIQIDRSVAASEAGVGFRNAAIANYMKSWGNLKNPVDDVLKTYYDQCAVAMSCKQLAAAGRYLAFLGTQAPVANNFIEPDLVRRINAVMMTCGHYDGSGEFAYRVGLPGKSGVGGGILAIAPGKGSIAVWSPGLDAAGNSLLGQRALEMLSTQLGWSVF